MLALLCSVFPAQAWPVEDAWVAISRSGGPVSDATDDHVHGDSAHGSVDIVGDDTEYALYWYADADSVYFRVKVDDDPWLTTGSSFRSSAWGFLFDTDDNPADWEYALTLSGPLSGVVSLYSNPSSAEGVAALGTFEGAWPAIFDDLVSVTESAVMTSGDTDYFVDLRIPRDDLDALAGAAFATTFRVAAVTEASATANPMDNDLAGSDDSSGIGALADGASDPIGIDQDADGLTDIEEDELGLDPTDADSDDDGLSDGEERALGTNPMECDSDHDGLHDGLEMSVDEAGPDTEVEAGCFAPDRDDASTLPLVSDTDGGKLLDGTEDRNFDGEIDAFETDPNDPLDDADTDEDLVPDAIEEECGGDDPDNRDGDDRDDAAEGLGDSDGDGIPDFCDEDDDNDGMNSVDEGEGDSDGDGVPDDRDPDSDKDGLADGQEGLADDDCDGFPDYRDAENSDGPCADPDGDGLTNTEEAACATDPEDEDTDDDGLGDAEESCTDDADCDQLPDAIDATDDARCDDLPPGDDTGGDCADQPFGACGDYVGGACSSVPAGAAAAGIALAALAVLGRRRRVLLAALAAPATASAGTNAQRFMPAAGGGDFLSIEDSALAGDGLAGGLWFNHAQAPLVYRFADEDLGESTILGSVETLDVVAAYSMKPLRFAVGMPFHLSDGDYQGSGAALGDLRVSAKASLLDRMRAPVGVAVTADLSLPTGDAAGFVGSGAPVFGGTASAAVGRTWVAAANVGVHGGAPAELGDLTWGTRLGFGVGAAVPVLPSLSVIGELDGELALDTLDAAGALPAEWRVGAAYRPWKDLVVRAGGGTGLTSGLGAPEWRAIAGVAWAPRAATKVEGALAAPVAEAISPPVAAEEPRGMVVVEVRNEAGHPLAALVTVLGAGTKFTTTGEGIGEQSVAPGAVELSAWSEGYRPERVRVQVSEGGRSAARITLQPSRVVVLPNQVQVRDKIFFEFDSAIIKAESFRILDDLAATLDNRPDIGIVEVQGHTDDQGTDEYNLKLSQARAESVRDYLVRTGVPADRLLARGYGESLPLQPGQSEEAREANRRVMFVILR